MKLILLVMLISSSAFAQNAVKLDKDQVAPFAGVLVTEEKIVELDKAKRSNILLRELGVTKDAIIEYYKDDAALQRRRLSTAKFNSFLANTGYFVMGVVLASIAFKINKEIGEI